MAGRQGWNLRRGVPGRIVLKGEAHPEWKGDAATAASKRCRAVNMYEIDACEDCGKPAIDRHHVDGDTGNNARENVRFLCRRCHMVADGRLERTKERLRILSKPQPSKPCANCHVPSKPLRKGRCDACSMYFYRTGVERPSERFTRNKRADAGKPRRQRSKESAHAAEPLGMPRGR